MIKLLLGGSPCTKWSIAQTSSRETKPEGEGWELFRNYLIAKQKYKPDYFLYENNKSAAQPIKDQISRELGVDLQYINSALVSAQNRQRFYAHNIPNVPQPDDRGILLKDILETGYGFANLENGKAYALTASYRHGEQPDRSLVKRQRTHAAEPIRIGTVENTAKNPAHDSKQYRVYSTEGKSTALCGQGGGLGAKTGLYACPDERIEYIPLKSCNVVTSESGIRCQYKDGNGTAQGYTVGFTNGKSPSVIAGQAGKMKIIENTEVNKKPVYEVRGGIITIQNKPYPIGLPDGFYIIRKLTVTECKRLQTVPDSYVFPVSDTQAYKMLGNGWTVDVIAHILSYIPGIREEEIEVLSMYDGMSCGHIALDKLSAKVVRYYATETDKYAIQTTMANYPETVQLGDAFGVRKDGWEL